MVASRPPTLATPPPRPGGRLDRKRAISYQKKGVVVQKKASSSHETGRIPPTTGPFSSQERRFSFYWGSFGSIRTTRPQGAGGLPPCTKHQISGQKGALSGAGPSPSVK
jgi:hypothetical protein